MGAESPSTQPAAGGPRQAGSVTDELPVARPGADARSPEPRRRRAPWVIAVVVVLVAAGVAVAVAKPFASAHSGQPANNADPTSLYTVARQDLSSQTQVSATLGYADSYSVAVPSGTSAQTVAQAQQAVTQDQQTLFADETAESDASAADNQTLSADETAESDESTADNQAITADQTDVNADKATLSSEQSTLNSDQTAETTACAGRGASSAACSQDTQDVSQDEQKVSSDQTALTQAEQQLASAQSSAKLDHDQNQAKVASDQTKLQSDHDQNEAKVASDQTKLQGDQATLASDQATETNPGTSYTWLPTVGEIIKEDQPVYSLSNEPVPLLYGSITAYRSFYVGMSDGGDVGELTRDLIALGYGAGLTQSNHYSSATATAVERWQTALGLLATGQILLGEVVFEPGPIRVTSVTPSVGDAVGSGGSGSGSGGGSTVLAATSTTRQVSIALDADEESEVAVGDKVSITLPNDDVTPGVISSVGTVATTSSGGSSPTITVLVNPTDPAATGDWDQAPVNVTITTESVTNALVVPVDSLLAQSGGGYAVEVVDADGIHHLVSVTLGLSDDADGLVQVTNTRLADGQQVVVPNL
jgi:chemotaxis protein histidine kinase CheA